MFDLAQAIQLFDAILLPLLGWLALFHAKFRCGAAARRAERRFLAVLVVMTLITMRTVITCHEAWLVHTLALGTLIIASMMIPGQDSTAVA